MNRIERISAILVRLQSRSVVTARQIADQFGVSLRTIYRDIRSLEEAGIPIIGEAGSGYSLVEGFKLPPLTFTTEEAIAFLMAEKIVNNQADGDAYELYCSGMNKIRAVLRTSEKSILENFDNRIQLIKSHSRPQKEPTHTLQSLLSCILEQKVAEIEYHANYNRQVTVRQIEPIGLYYMTDNWYIMAWCKLRKDYRTFNLTRISKLILVNITFENKHPELKTILNTLYSENFFIEIKLKVEKYALKNMGMAKYIHGLYKEDDCTDYVIQHYSTYSLEYFGRWYLSFADQAVIIEPQELKDIVKNLISKITI